MGKYWILATLMLGLAACTDKPAEAPVEAPAPAPKAEPAAPAPEVEPETVVAPVATDAALQASDIDAYLRGLAKEVQLLRDEYARIEQARAADDSDAETAALFAMTSSAIEEAGAVASGLPAARYDYIRNRIDEIGDSDAGIGEDVAAAFEAGKDRIAALRGEAIGLRLKAAGG